ncbi:MULTISPECIES: hypothetical protein [Deinococcus]|uniref:hypothetical protein n=1 Tax=Deinococcus TaxID=1298 RepID=UPI00166ACD26|nr:MULTISPECIES: hypothetical protein [Deinococcus]MDK2014032.1 hypothetical protein [Deinococcus sp. 43]GGB78741.1 hypothetical protein GCM10008019_38770 [Deinococcus soli (ex Cha et al. 2016)]
MNRFPITLLTLAGLSVGVGLAQTSPITLALVQELVRTVTVNGKTSEALTPAPKSVVPGDLVRQQLTATNTSDRPINRVVLKLPVPEHATYIAVERSDVPGEVRTEFSADGGKTFGLAPLKKTVLITENGQSVHKEVTVPPSDYTTVRWTLNQLPARAQATVGFRMRVD